VTAGAPPCQRTAVEGNIVDAELGVTVCQDAAAAITEDRRRSGGGVGPAVVGGAPPRHGRRAGEDGAAVDARGGRGGDE
jgi:hypothetical protein